MSRFANVYFLCAIVLVTFNLRPALVTIGPVLPFIGTSLSLSASALGVLTSLPILMLGVASSVAEPFGRRVGWSGGVAVASVMIAIGTVLRSSGSIPALFAGAVVLGCGIGIGNVYVPTLLKWRYAHRLGLLMGIYTFCLSGGAMVSVGLTPALLQHFGGDWKPALSFWALPSLACAVVWLPLLRFRGSSASASAVPLWRNGLAWAVTAFMGFQSMMFYSLASWYGALLHDRGLTVAAISLNLSVLYVTQMIFSLILPIVLVRTRRQEPFAVALPAIVGAGVVGALYGPLTALPVWSAVIGLALGGVFGVALTFMVLRARYAESAARLSGMAQTVGYLLAALGPLGLGLLHGTSDPRLASTLWLVSLAIVTAIVGAIAGRNAFVEGGETVTLG